MTTERTGRKDPETKVKKEASQEDLRAAYEIHTLAQILYGQITMANPWVTPVSPLASFQSPAAFVPPMAVGAPPAWPTPWSV